MTREYNISLMLMVHRMTKRPLILIAHSLGGSILKQVSEHFVLLHSTFSGHTLTHVES